MRPGLRQDPYVGWLPNEAMLYAILFLAGAALGAMALPPTPAALSAIWWGIVLIVIRSDIATLTIPDEASFAVAVLGCIQAYLNSDVAASAWTGLADALVRGLSAFSIFWLVKAGYRRWRGHEGLGFGDVKLAGACAIWINPSDQVIALEIAAAAAAALTVLKGARGKGTLIPFGAFLAPAAWLVFVAHSWFEMR